MTQERLNETVLETTKLLTVTSESVKTAHKRIDVLVDVTNSIHELSKSVALVTAEIKSLTSQVGSGLTEIRLGQRDQAERIAAIEVKELGIEKRILERGNKKWDGVFITVVAGLLLAIIFYFLGISYAL